MMGAFPADPERIVGGVEAVVVYLSRELARRPGLELHLATVRAGLAAPQQVAWAGIPVHLLPRPRLGRLTAHRAVRRALHGLIDRIAPDLVHAHGTGFYGLAALDCGRPYLVTAHGIATFEIPFARGLSRFSWILDSGYERFVAKRAANIIAISPYVERVFRAWGVGSQTRFFSIENPVADDFFQLAGQPQPGELLFAGRVFPRKGVRDLIAALPAVIKRVPGLCLRIAGETTTDPAYVAAVRADIARLGLTARVQFLGSLDRPRLRAAYATASVVVLPALQETAPVTIAEAMAAGRPVVATAVGGVPDLVTDGVTGRVVPPGDPPALASALIDVLSHPEQATAMGQAARAAALDRFHVARVADRTLQAYRAVSRQ